MLVWRLEKNGIGPYTYDEYHQDLPHSEQEILNDLNNFHNPHPYPKNPAHPPVSEDIGKFDKEMVCGFKSIEDLRKWFKGFLRELKKIGFEVKVYTTNEYIEGRSGKQLMFKPLDKVELPMNKKRFTSSLPFTTFST